ncbi:hypothetical protein [Litoribrevibacter albus]|uniref:Uncharacterized protein n=1 Tax=Litoribrevibacter albus TaxID=1473156 RepID=A0AA37S835_9GAMM|nr:hypothetical protein [Litoribrevibacter albus]GLQ29974.1 hypothetical protein GCM10007876_04520 [Litoribrevibacter albus]
MTYLVKIEFFEVDDPGCCVKYRSGIRPTISYEKGILWDCYIALIDVEEATPRESVDAILSFLSPQEHVSKIKKGLAFDLYAGPWLIGKGYFLE